MTDMQLGSARLPEPLTEREQEILTCLVEGLSNHEIAQKLHLAHRTVKWYNSHIYGKLGVNNRDDAVIRSQELGLCVPPNKQAAGRHNLPHQMTPFIGRRQELEDLAQLIAEPDTRMVTILAPGGMGKTRLAAEVARRQIGRFAQGIFFVPLAPLSSPNDIVTTIAENISFVLQSEDAPALQLVDFLKDREILLVLDNFEHLMERAGLVSDIISSTHDIKIVTTSRERLNLRGEIVYDLRGMALPTWETPEDAMEYDAVKLFMQSAHRLRPKFEFHLGHLNFRARICRLTAGMPLGIELAAGWVDVLSLEQIAGEIQQGIDILESDMRDIPERHRSLRATFERTWQRLTDEEQTVFASLSVFRGGFTRESAEAVTGASIRHLRKLAQKALIQTEINERYAIHELVRQFGASKLEESAELAIIQANHADHFADFMVKREHDLKNGNQLEGLTLIDPDFENVRLSWHYVVDHHQWEMVPKFRYSLWFYCDLRARFPDMLALAAYTIDTLKTLSPSAEVQLNIGRMLAWSSWFHYAGAFHERARPLAEEAIELLQGFDDGLEDLIIAYHTLGGLAMYAEDMESNLTRAKHNYALAEKLGDFTWLGQTALFAAVIGQPHKEITLLNLAKKWFGNSGDRHGMWLCGFGETLILLERNKISEAYKMMNQAESQIAPFDSAAHLAITCRILGILALLQDDNRLAANHFGYAVQRLWESGLKDYSYGIWLRLAQAQLYLDNYEIATAIMLLLDDTPPNLRDLYYDGDKAINLQIGYEELKCGLLEKLEAAKLDHLWESVEKPTLNELITRLLAELNEA